MAFPVDASCPPPNAPVNPLALSRHARWLRTLGDPTRLAIVELLLRCRGSLCACDIERCFKLSQPTISHHLRLLRQAGLVRSERRGTWMHYELAPQCIDTVREFASELAALSTPVVQGDHHA